MANSVLDQITRRLASAGGIAVQRRGAADLLLRVEGAEVPISLEIQHRPSDAGIEQFAATSREDGAARAVLAVPTFSSRRRRELRQRNISWIEFKTGVVHLRVPHLAIDLPEDPELQLETNRTLPSLAGKAGIVLETLVELARRRDAISQSEVAHRSGSTQAWTSKVFSALVRAGALEVVGAGPSKQWRPHPEALLRLWETEGGPKPTTTPMYLWSRTSEELLASLARVGNVTDAYAIGGVAAANLHEPTLTSLPLVHVWIPASEHPTRVAQHLDAQLIESGANVHLWQAPNDPALTLAEPLRRWRTDAPTTVGRISVVTPGRAAIEALHGTGRSLDVGENLRRRILIQCAEPHA